MLYMLLKSLILPPGCFFILVVIGWLVGKWRPRLGRVLLWALLVVGYLATTPFLAGELLAPLQRYQPVDVQKPDSHVGAIVVLGAGINYSAPEYWNPEAPPFGFDVADALSLQRIAYAAYLARATGKPLLLSGGATRPSSDRTVAKAMSVTLARDFGITPRWLEERSTTTQSNAVYSAKLLHAEGIDKIYLVTHAWHMPRALIAFEGTGIEVIPAPTGFVSRSGDTWHDFIPSAQGLLLTYYAVHEWLGIAWYRIKVVT